MLLLSITLGALTVGIFALGWEMLVGARRRAALAAAPRDELRSFLRAASPMVGLEALPIALAAPQEHMTEVEAARESDEAADTALLLPEMPGLFPPVPPAPLSPLNQTPLAHETQFETEAAIRSVLKSEPEFTAEPGFTPAAEPAASAEPESEPPSEIAPVQQIADDAPIADGFIFRRNVSREFASMEISHKRFRTADSPPAPPATSTASVTSALPAPVDFSTIQNEIRAALTAPPQAEPSRPAQGAQLTWTEPGRLAVLSLGGSTARAGLALLSAHNISVLIAPPGHPFGTHVEGIEILTVTDKDAAVPLAVTLRAKLASGAALAFFTETGLTGAIALLAAQFSRRSA